jgi:hypothetical protein
MLADGDVAIARDAVVVHCAARGLRYPPLVPIWGAEAITLQPIRNTYACFGPALAGFVEATLADDDEKNRLCPPVPFSNTTADWAHQQVVGARASFTRQPHIEEWVDTVSLNPARIPAELVGSPAVTAAAQRLRRLEAPGLAKLASLADIASREGLSRDRGHGSPHPASDAGCSKGWSDLPAVHRRPRDRGRLPTPWGGGSSTISSSPPSEGFASTATFQS